MQKQATKQLPELLAGFYCRENNRHPALTGSLNPLNTRLFDVPPPLAGGGQGEGEAAIFRNVSNSSPLLKIKPARPSISGSPPAWLSQPTPAGFAGVVIAHPLSMPPSFPKEAAISHARGAFIGFAVGDALGAPVEFMTRGEIRDRYGELREMVGGGWLRLKAGQVTDDTEMSLCIARAIVEGGGWSLTRIAENLAGWLKSKPIDVGDTCRRGIRNYMLRGKLETPPNEWDAGNGAAMRNLPVALFTLGDEQLLERYTLQQAHLTHNHPLSDAASVTFGRLLHLALTGRSMRRLRREADQLVAQHPTFAFDPYKGMATGYVVDTMQTVFHCFFNSRSFERCLVDTVNQGGDADTTGAIAGALAGAFYGEESIPERWRKRLDRKLSAEIGKLAEGLVGMSPLYGKSSKEGTVGQ